MLLSLSTLAIIILIIDFYFRNGYSRKEETWAFSENSYNDKKIPRE
jgi:hypothetical protein